MAEASDKDFSKRRKHRRVAVREVTAEIRAGGISFSYAVLNISTGGLLVTGEHKLPRRGTVEIELKQGGRAQVQLLGHVVHELAQGTGIEFEALTPAVAEAVEVLIAAVEARGMPPPLPPGRVTRDDIPPVGPRPNDSFGTGPDPRPPRSASPDERAEYLRILLKKRDEALANGRTAFAAVVAEADALREVAARMKSKLDAAVSMVTVGEAALASARAATHQQEAALEVERATAREMLDDEARRTLEAIGTVAGLEAKLRRFETDLNNVHAESEAALAAAHAQAEAARREADEVQSDVTGLRKAREELSAANRKAMEAQVAFNKERTSRQTAEATISSARNAQQKAEADASRLTEEVARLKAKLITAETAIERLATRKVTDPLRKLK